MTTLRPTGSPSLTEGPARGAGPFLAWPGPPEYPDQRLLDHSRVPPKLVVQLELSISICIYTQPFSKAPKRGPTILPA